MITKINRVISIDLWNTLIQVQSKNSNFLVKLLSEKSHLKDVNISHIVKITGTYFDGVAIYGGVEIPSSEKIRTLIANTKANTDTNDVIRLILNDLTINPPGIIEPKALDELDNALDQKGLGLIISSNSGFVPASVMRTIIENLGLVRLKSYRAAFFSEEMGYAKPSKLFFATIEQQGYQILVHCGDHPVADCGWEDAKFQKVLFNPRQISYSDFFGIQIDTIKNLAAFAIV